MVFLTTEQNNKTEKRFIVYITPSFMYHLYRLNSRIERCENLPVSRHSTKIHLQRYIYLLIQYTHITHYTPTLFKEKFYFPINLYYYYYYDEMSVWCTHIKL